MASSTSFKGLSFYIPIGSSLKKTSKQLQTLLVSHGGTLAVSFGDQVTHALVSDSEMASNSNLIEKALKKGVSVITEAWLQHTIKNGGAPVNAPNGTIIRPAATGKTYSSALVRATVPQVPVPVLSLMLPHTGPNTGNFKVAVFGQRFVPGPGFRIRVGHLDAVDYEFHSETSVVATIPATSVPFAPGQTLTGVSNDGGANWCQPLVFSVYDPITSAAPLPPPAMMTQHAMSSLLASAASHSSGGQLLLESSSSISPGASSKDVAASSADVLRPKQLLKALDREVRVFISSPFTDMQKERDTLVRSAIPKLRRLCMQRDVAFSYVDLRWGVTAQQSESAVSLLLCLREIENCNLFIGFYGERYGWCVSPERDQTQNELLRRSIAAAAKEYPWVSEMSTLSMSEIEMRMVLDRKYQHGDKQSWFYLRDPYYVEEMPEKERHLYRSESDRAHAQLESFKRYLTVHSRPTNYARPDDVSELVFEDIKNHIDREYPAEDRLSPLERERFRHNVYSRAFTHCYLPNEVYFNALDRHVSNVLPMPIVVTGASGIGKSALLSNWVLRHNEHAPEDIVIHHWVGCSPHSSNAGQVLSRILLELRKTLDFQDDKILPREAGSAENARPGASASESGLGLDVKKVIKEFLNSLKTITSRYNFGKRRIVLVIDGLDKIDARENAQDLIWLPHTFPKSVRVILSCSPCFVLDVLKKRKGIEFLEINPMAEADRKAFIRLYLTHRSKRLTEKQEFHIAQAAQTSHPLYLKTLLDDLSEFGKFEQLDQKINLNLQASNASSLYDIVLRRLEDEHDRKAGPTKPTLAASAMPSKPSVPVTNAFLSLLWGSRRGLLLNSELDQLLTLKRGIPEEIWMDFFVVADETLLADCSGLLLFANEDVRKAVEARYLKNEASKIEVHKELATFFEAIPDLTERKVEELPHQLAESKQWDKLRNCLRELAMFDRLYTSEAHKFDLLRYWRLLESQGSEYDIVENYKTVVSRGLFPAGLIVGDLIYHLGRFMLEMDKNAGAEFMFQKAEAYYHQASQMLNVAKVSAALGELYFTQMRHEDCERMLKKSISIFEKEKGTQSQALVHPLDRLGVLYTAQHKHDLALASLERALQISESNAGADTVESANVIYDLACTYLSIGENLEIAKAEQFLLRALAIKEAALGPWDVEVSHVLLRLGAMYLEHDQFADAEECLNRSLLIRETKLGRDHSRVAQCLRHLITCHEMQEQYAKAIEVGERALAITKRVYGETNFHTSGVLLRIGTVVLTEGKPGSTQRAKKLVTDAMEMRKKLFSATHRCVVECQKILDSMNPTPVSTPTGYPPPPPFPRASAQQQQQILQQIQTQKPLKQLVYNAQGIPVGPAPPPPPPKAGVQSLQKPAVRAAIIEQGPSNAGYLEQLQNFSQAAALNRNDETRDRSDASKQAKNMLGAGERRIQFKKKAKWA